MHTTFKEKAKRVRVNPRATKAKANLPKAKDAAAGGTCIGMNQTFQHPSPRNDHQASSAVNDSNATIDSTPDDTSSVRSHTSVRSSASSAHQVHGNNTTAQLISSASNPDPKFYYYCNYHGWNLSHAGPQCRVMLNDSKYSRAQHEATSPVDTTPLGNMQIEPEREDNGRKRTFLKSCPTARTHHLRGWHLLHSRLISPRHQ
jgi:hypothetical protein